MRSSVLRGSAPRGVPPSRATAARARQRSCGRDQVSAHARLYRVLFVSDSWEVRPHGSRA